MFAVTIPALGTMGPYVNATAFWLSGSLDTRASAPRGVAKSKPFAA